MARTNRTADASGWVGWVYFGAMMMMLLGTLHFIAGMVALFKEEVYVLGPEALWVLNIQSWGWIHLIAGVVVFMAGVAVLSGKMWGRVVGVLLGVLAAIANFAFIPVYPVWSILMFTISVLVVFALVAHGSEAKDLLE